jgi:hypothetical protein
MNERKDMGELPKAEVVPPTPTGKKAVVVLQIDILVEVVENDSYTDMLEQAKAEAQKRVKEGKGFLPFRSSGKTIYDATTVDYLQQRLTINPTRSW